MHILISSYVLQYYTMYIIYLYFIHGENKYLYKHINLPITKIIYIYEIYKVNTETYGFFKNVEKHSF